MGCGGSKSAAAPGGAVDNGSSTSLGGDSNGVSKSNANAKLLDYYVLGDVLGQGAFGIVYACAAKGSQNFTMAVKMVDKYETPLDEIMHETDMLRLLAHPNVVKFHNSYHEKCFVCLVMDRYNGGDLIEGMQLHWKKKGKIPPRSVIHIIRQMAAAIAHLHSKITAHRDVKGDNFLTDRKDIRDPQCRVLMSDFGTAVTLKKPDERMTKSCGTKVYWSPEFYRLRYGLKVDVWALGVICFGLLEGRFPYKREADVMANAVPITQQAPKDCTDLLHQLLEKDEDKRLSAQAVTQHPWIYKAEQGDEATPTANGEGDANGTSFTPEAVRENMNVAADQRRKELVGRLEEKQAANEKKKDASALWNHKFAVSDTRKGRTARYEWWPKEKAMALIADGGMSVSEGKGDTLDIDLVDKMLREHGIDSSKFGVGKARTLEQFAQEVHVGSALLMLDASTHKKLVRVVDVVLLRVDCGGKFCIEMSETLPDGRKRENLNRLPGTKKDPHENVRTCAQRIASTMLNLGGKLSYSFVNMEIFEEEEESISYPGVMTVYRKTIVACKANADVKQEPFSHTDPAKVDKKFNWLSEADCRAKKIHIFAPTSADDVSALVQAPVGMHVDDLRTYLVNNKVDPERFGKDGAKTLENLSEELLKGESSIMLQGDQVLRVVDVVVLLITKEGEDEILVETQEKLKDGTINTLDRLPGIKRRPDENMFSAGQKLLTRQLQIDENCVSIDGKNTQTIEKEKESAHYPGIRTLYRRRIIRAELLKQ